MGLFFSLLTYRQRKSVSHQVILQTFGKEKNSEGTILNREYIELGDNDFLADDTEDYICLCKLINPFKYIEACAYLLYLVFERASLLWIDDDYGTLEFWHPRTLARLVAYAAKLIYEAVRFITSPWNQIIRPFFNFLKQMYGAEGVSDEWAGVWGSLFLGKVGTVGFILLTLAVLGFIAVSLFSGGIFPGVIFLGAASSALVAGAASLAASLSSIITSAIVTVIIAKISLLIISGLISIGLMQRFFEYMIPALIDIAFGIAGYKGYSKQQHMIALQTMEPCTEKDHQHIYEWGDPNMHINMLDTSGGSKFAKSTSLAFEMFNAPLTVVSVNPLKDQKIIVETVMNSEQEVQEVKEDGPPLPNIDQIDQRTKFSTETKETTETRKDSLIGDADRVFHISSYLRYSFLAGNSSRSSNTGEIPEQVNFPRGPAGGTRYLGTGKISFSSS